MSTAAFTPWQWAYRHLNRLLKVGKAGFTASLVHNGLIGSDLSTELPHTPRLYDLGGSPVRIAVTFFRLVLACAFLLTALVASNVYAQTLLPPAYLVKQASGQTWFYEDGSREYFLPNGSSYHWRDGAISYNRWSLSKNGLCFSGVSTECMSATALGNGQIRLNNSQGNVRILGKRRGDSENIVRLYGQGLRKAIDTGTLRLARSKGPDRNDPLGFQRLLRAEEGALTARDGTVGRFAIPPAAVKGVIPQANVADMGQPAQSLLPQSLKPAQQAFQPARPAAPQMVIAQPSSPKPQTPKQPVSRPQTPAPQSAAPLVSDNRILFSRTVDKDPGCYLHLARCERRCNTTAPKFSLFRLTQTQCRAQCRSTYICAK